MKLDVAIDDKQLTLALQAPLDNLLGFERAPRNDTERQAAAAVLARLRNPDKTPPLFTPDAAAQCRLSQTEVLAPVLEPSARPAAPGDHADVEASYTFVCAQPGALRSLDVGLFAAYPRLQRIDVQVAGPTGQAQVNLKRPGRSVKLAR